MSIVMESLALFVAFPSIFMCCLLCSMAKCSMARSPLLYNMSAGKTFHTVSFTNTLEGFTSITISRSPPSLFTNVVSALSCPFIGFGWLLSQFTDVVSLSYAASARSVRSNLCPLSITFLTLPFIDITSTSVVDVIVTFSYGLPSYVSLSEVHTRFIVPWLSSSPAVIRSGEPSSSGTPNRALSQSDFVISAFNVNLLSALLPPLKTDGSFECNMLWMLWYNVASLYLPTK